MVRISKTQYVNMKQVVYVNTINPNRIYVRLAGSRDSIGFSLNDPYTRKFVKKYCK